MALSAWGLLIPLVTLLGAVDLLCCPSASRQKWEGEVYQLISPHPDSVQVKQLMEMSLHENYVPGETERLTARAVALGGDG